MSSSFQRIYALVLTGFLVLGLTGCAEAPTETLLSPQEDLSHVYTLSRADMQTEYPDVQDLVFEENKVCLITKAGAYRLTGDLTGQIRIDAQDEIVSLILEDANLKSYSGPAICVRDAAKVVLTLPEGTSSSLTDSSFYEDQPSEDACVFSNCDLTINGAGNLVVTGNYGDAVRTKDVLKICNASVSVRAKDHGLRGADGVVLENAAVDLQCEGNGIYTTKESKPGRGFAAVSGGTLNIIAGAYGMEIAENLYLPSGTAQVYGVLGNIRCLGLQYVREECLQ